MHTARLLLLIALPALMLLGACASQRSASARKPDIRTKEVIYTVDNQQFRGVMAWDENAAGKHPGILVCHEWWGNNEYAPHRAEMLAGEGYVAFALDMYGIGKTTHDPKQAGEWAGEVNKDPAALRRRVVAGLDVLRTDPHVDTAKLASIGYCFGGSIALEAARSGAAGKDLRAVVCFHTSGLTAKNASDNANIKARVLVCHGDADTFVQPDMIPNFEKQMKDAGVKYDIKRYPGAVHAFTNPSADSFGLKGVAYNKAADEQSWQDMLALFHKAF